MRSSRLPKRLCEALVGAAVQRTVPSAVLWPPPTFRPHDGFGPLQPALQHSLLFQCSPAEIRVAGPSTRVSRAQLDAYRELPRLGVWRRRVRFVLPGIDADCLGMPLSDYLLPMRFRLYVVGVDDLADVVDRQQRGTINANTLEELTTCLSEHVPGARARPLEEELTAWKVARCDPEELIIEAIPDHQPAWTRLGFNWLTAPSPIAVALVPPFPSGDTSL